MENKKVATAPTIYLDCDGVLADFDNPAETHFGVHPAVFEDIHGHDQFWSRLMEHPNFYRILPLMPDARQLFEAVRQFNPIILTGCHQGTYGAQDKIDWAAEHFPETQVITCFSREKSTYCKPGDVLIDDYTRYRDLWLAKGGIFIHHTSAAQSIRDLAEVYPELFSQQAPTTVL